MLENINENLIKLNLKLNLLNYSVLYQSNFEMFNQTSIL